MNPLPPLIDEQGIDGEVLTSSVFASHNFPAPAPAVWEIRCSWCDKGNGEVITGDHISHAICPFHLAIFRRDMEHELAKNILTQHLEELYPAVLFLIALEAA